MLMVNVSTNAYIQTEWIVSISFFIFVLTKKKWFICNWNGKCVYKKGIFPNISMFDVTMKMLHEYIIILAYGSARAIIILVGSPDFVALK